MRQRGLIRGKASGIQGLPGRLDDGIGLTVAMMETNAFDQFSKIDGMGPVGEIRLVPDLDYFSVLPYAPSSAALPCNMVKLDGVPWEACPRSFLKRMRAFAADQGLRLNAAMEAEFILAHPGENGWAPPFDRTVCFLVGETRTFYAPEDAFREGIQTETPEESSR